jgi:8-hydroxy-5-deazaflavin:NADPH oxidoreductase
VDIAIIGAGNVGRALASSLSRAGHDVTLAARDAEATAAAAVELGVSSAPSPGEAAAGADVVILAVPGDAAVPIVEALDPTLEGAVVVDVTNRMQPDPTTDSNAEQVQRATRAPVVKAFNTAFASRQADPVVEGRHVDGYVAGDDPDAKARILELVESVGFRPVDAGPLAAARMLEGMAWLNIARNINGGSWQSAWVLVDPTEEKAA